MFKVQATCPTRIDLAGGTLDLWPLYHQLSRKATVNLAIDLCASVEVCENSSGKFSFESLDQKLQLEGSFSELQEPTSLPLLSLFLKALWGPKLPGLHIKTKAKSPKGAGLGGSSSLAIALSAALLKARELCGASKEEISEQWLVSLCQDVESTIIEAPTGCQDYWAAVRGGLNFITYPPGAVKVETEISESLESLNDHLLVVYSGQSRASALNNWSVYQSFFAKEENTVSSLCEIGSLAEECLLALKAKDLKNALSLSEKEWRVREKLWPDITTEQTKKVDDFACFHGALFTRVCGAGGGGVMGVFVEPSKKKALRAELLESHFEVLETEITAKGLQVISS